MMNDVIDEVENMEFLVEVHSNRVQCPSKGCMACDIKNGKEAETLLSHQVRRYFLTRVAIIVRLLNELENPTLTILNK